MKYKIRKKHSRFMLQCILYRTIYSIQLVLQHKITIYYIFIVLRILLAFSCLELSHLYTHVSGSAVLKLGMPQRIRVTGERN